MPRPTQTHRRAAVVLRHVRPRFWVQSVLGTLTVLTFAATLVSREWIELVFGVDPDEGSGALEWLVVAVLAVVSAALFLLARTEWRRAAATVAAAGA